MALLFRLLIAHLLSDFVFIPLFLQEDQENKKAKSLKIFWKVTINTLLVYAFSGLYNCWWLPLIIFTSNYIFAILKSYLPNNFLYFIINQILHLGLLVLIWVLIERQWPILFAKFFEIIRNTKFWMISFGYVLVSWPFGTLIGKATLPWRNDIETNETGKAGLANSGKWIGICERILILTFILTNEYTSIGLLIAAKSILRFGDKEGTQKKTEYILVGTLASFTLSTLLGIILAYSIK